VKGISLTVLQVEALTQSGAVFHQMENEDVDVYLAEVPNVTWKKNL